MIHYIENEQLKIGVKEQGCELTSIFSKKDNTERLWQGDKSIWNGQSPILFPVIGRLLDDKYILDGKEYEMPKHGFARNIQWSLKEKSENSISFILTDSEQTFKMYPFRFKLIVTFTLEENKLSVRHTVINTDSRTIYFSLGAHPAFVCRIGDRLSFDTPETLDSMKIDLEKSLLLTETKPVLKDETDIVITKDIFNEDALIFEGVKSEYVTLTSDNHNRKIRFNLGGAPYLGIWAKPGAPYVCIEPWYGLNDTPERKADLSLKTGINTLSKKEEFNFTWSAEII